MLISKIEQDFTSGGKPDWMATDHLSTKMFDQYKFILTTFEDIIYTFITFFWTLRHSGLICITE